MNVLFLNKFNDYWKEKFKHLKEEFPAVHFTATYDPKERPAALKAADAVVSGRITKEEIENSPNLKVIFVPFTGINTFPIEIIRERGIVLANTHANAPVVAEHAVALCLALLGGIIEFHTDLKQGFWNRSIEGEDMWVSLYNRKVGIAGFGNIGQCIAKLLKPFNCHIIGFKRKPDAESSKYANEITTDLSYLIDKSEILFITLPLNESTTDLFNKERLMKMNGKYLINVGRGGTVNEDGLYESLKQGILQGAALDVWYNYPGKKEEPVFPANKPFWELHNVVLSPHKSSHTVKAINAMIDDTFENIRIYLKTGTRGNMVKHSH